MSGSRNKGQSKVHLWRPSTNRGNPLSNRLDADRMRSARAVADRRHSCQGEPVPRHTTIRFTRARPLIGCALLLLALATQSLPAQEQRRPPIPTDFPNLVSGLRATPGCLGVETARTASGKQVIFAWFRDKQAVLNWYYSEMHRSVQNRFFPNRPPHTPLSRIPDGTGPILAIASLTWADSATSPVTTLPLSQIAIELYQPLPGGVFVGGRFAPDSVQVSGMLDYTPRTGPRP